MHAAVACTWPLKIKEWRASLRIISYIYAYIISIDEIICTMQHLSTMSLSPLSLSCWIYKNE